MHEAREKWVFNSKSQTCKDMQKMNKMENPHFQKMKKILWIKFKFESKNILSIAQDFGVLIKSAKKKKSISMHMYAFSAQNEKKSQHFENMQKHAKVVCNVFYVFTIK